MAAATPDDRAAGLKHVPAIAGAPWGRCPVGEATCGEPGRRRRVRRAGPPAEFNKQAGNTGGSMSTHSDRSLLYISRHHDVELCEFLESQHWRVMFASTSREVERLTLPDQPLAGLLDVHSGYSDRDLDRLEPFFTLNTIGWVASTRHDETLTEKRRQLLGLYFLDYFTLPREAQFIAQSLGHASGMASLRQTGSAATSQVTMLKGMVGACDAMQGLFRTIGKIAKSDAPVLITTTSSPVIRRSLPSATSIPFCASILSAIARSSRACASCIVLACGFIPDRNV